MHLEARAKPIQLCLFYGHATRTHCLVCEQLSTPIQPVYERVQRQIEHQLMGFEVGQTIEITRVNRL